MHEFVVSALRRFPSELAALYATIPCAYAAWAPPSWEGIPSERFTAIEQICHVRDIEIDGYQLRLRRLLGEDNPLLVSIDSERVARERGYPDAPVEQVFEAFREARERTAQTIAGLTESQWQRRGVFEGYGPVTVKGLMHYLCSHDQQHLAGLHWLLGQMASGAAPSGR
ncbi:DinB family protein [Massilia scottii]|uniref:DinB family protein n=1 Tax=Massilia scottii TaxID=3057166 RepID=UPI002796635A|nr:DinB family protein [Massilia sp. CCM 9029]MDQ1833120.1 DinB family protein [Massilia sp. CCM 9029]